MARNRRFVLICVMLGLSLLISGTLFAKNVVIPTYYGYGVVSTNGGWVYPYVTGPAYGGFATPYYGPYNYYYLSGYYPYYGSYYQGYPQSYWQGSPQGNLQGYTPRWTGSQWVYTAGNAGGEGYAVSTRDLNLRSRAEKGNNVIGSLSSGETVYIQGRYGNWCLVQSAAYPAKRGYAHAKYLAAGTGGNSGWNAWMNYYVPRGW